MDAAQVGNAPGPLASCDRNPGPSTPKPHVAIATFASYPVTPPPPRQDLLERFTAPVPFVEVRIILIFSEATPYDLHWSSNYIVDGMDFYSIIDGNWRSYQVTFWATFLRDAIRVLKLRQYFGRAVPHEDRSTVRFRARANNDADCDSNHVVVTERWRQVRTWIVGATSPRAPSSNLCGSPSFFGITGPTGESIRGGVRPDELLLLGVRCATTASGFLSSPAR